MKDTAKSTVLGEMIPGIVLGELQDLDWPLILLGSQLPPLVYEKTELGLDNFQVWFQL